MIIKDDQYLTDELVSQYFSFDQEKNMYQLHKSEDKRFPSFYFSPGYGLHVEKDGVQILLTYEVDYWGRLKMFFNLMGIPFDF
jgi:hypothetical protein